MKINAWFTIEELNAWADKKLKDNPQWAERPHEVKCPLCYDDPANIKQPAQQQCRTDGRCQYAIDSGAEGLGHCPKGKCVMPAQQEPAGAVYRYGKDSSGKPWHGIRWTASGLDLPDGTLIYTSPQSKPLTDEQLQEIEAATWGAAFLRPQSARKFARAIEAAHGIKGDA